MHQMNEDIAWFRLQDLQREMENSRLLAGQRSSAVAGLARKVWALVRAAWPTRPDGRLREEPDSASDAA